jgi:hypothetical protein
MGKREVEEEAWETQSLAWIHNVRRELQRARAGKRARPLPRKRAEALARKYGLKLLPPAPGRK